MRYDFTAFSAANNAMKPLVTSWLRAGRQLAKPYIVEILERSGWGEWVQKEGEQRFSGEHAVLGFLDTKTIQFLKTEEAALLIELLNHPLFRFRAYLDDTNSVQVDWIDPP